MKLSDKLNKEQKAAILHVEGPLRIIAGPGSGKTRVLTHKVAYLIENIGYNPKKILAVTFTNKAANEMKSRIHELIGEKSNGATICTFHSLAVRILREEIHVLGFSPSFRIIDTVDQKQILKAIFKTLKIEKSLFSVSNMIDFISTFKIMKKDLEEEIKFAKTPGDLTKLKIYGSYRNHTREIHALDFDDLLLYVDEIFHNHPAVRAKWASRFDYVLVDEFQDTSQVQYDIAKTLSSKDNNITIVGDPDQTIYTWRGADLALFLDFDKAFPNCATIKLVENYRSTKMILHSANCLIKNNFNRIDKNLITNNEDGFPIEYYHGLNSGFEARWVINRIRELRKEKNQLKDIAIFYRANYLSKNIETALIEEGIEYKIFGGTKFFQRAEIKDVINFLAIISNLNDDTAIKRIINTPARKLSPTTQEKIFKVAEKYNLPIVECVRKRFKEMSFLNAGQRTSMKDFIDQILRHHILLKKYGISVVLKAFLEKIGYFAYLQNSDSEDRIANITELLDGLVDFEEKNRDLKVDNYQKINNYLQETALFFSQDEISEIIDFVSLMTVHTAKGLEYKNVFVVGFSEGIFPTHQAITSIDDELMEEERRLAYVAITRAQKRLFISDSKGYSVEQSLEKRPSRFLHEMDIEKTFANATQTFKLTSTFETNQEEIDFVVGDRIKHIKFGFGQVVAVKDEIIDVAFSEPYGVKSLMKNHKAIERDE